MQLKSLLSISFLGSAAMQLAAQTSTKPNILVIVADDLGTNELGCYGGTNVQTPNIDKLASEGVRMTNSYASSSMSVPIRASLFTGLYPARHGSFQNHKKTYTNVKSVTTYLANLGYRVGRTGKDHPINQPVVYAFENVPGFTVNCTASTAPYTTDGVQEFIQRSGSQPFCLYVCSTNPHMPWSWGDASKFNPSTITLPPNMVDNTKTRSEFCKYLAEIKELDNEVGSVMEVLKNSGKLDNTLVIFLGEQGPQLPFGKWTCYNYGQYSAFIARYPSKITPNTINPALVQYEDVLPTLIEFAGGNTINNLDGTSCLDALYGNKQEHRQWAYGIHNNYPEGSAYPIRSIQDKRYKLIVNLIPDVEYYCKYVNNPTNTQSMWASWLTTAQTNPAALFLTNRYVNRPAIELYDLQTDWWEMNNLAGRPEHAERINLMRAELEKWMIQQGDKGVLLDYPNPESTSMTAPVALKSVADINNLLRTSLNGNFYLTNDIVIPEGTEWIPIGAASATDSNPQAFKGAFDGQGFAIKGLKINTASSYKGFFAQLNHAVVRDVDFTDVSINGGAVVGAVSATIVGETRIEKVSVSGIIEADTEVGGIVGRVGTDVTFPGYNIIQDSYVTADVKATSLSTDMNNPSCAGGIVALSKGNTNGNYGKINIRRVYVTGKITSEQKNNAAGNAAGILPFYDQHKYIKMDEVLVLADTIGSATSNLFFCRRGPTYADFELFNKVYARSGIILNYLSATDKGRGGEIPDGVINYHDRNVFKTRQFYDDNLSWDFTNTWTINENEYPVLNRTKTSFGFRPQYKNDFKIVGELQRISVQGNGVFSLALFDLSGRLIINKPVVSNQISIPATKGIYVVSLAQNGIIFNQKVVSF
jgi:uncharacterized sulfatase